MALSARPIGVPSGPNVSSAHMPSGGRNIASMSFSPIEEIGAKAEVFADPNFSFDGFTSWSQNQGQQSQRPPSNPTSNFDVTSTTFVHLINQHQRDNDAQAPGAVKDGPGYQKFVSKAIQAYEGIANVIGNAPKTRGTSVSLSM